MYILDDSILVVCDRGVFRDHGHFVERNLFINLIILRAHIAEISPQMIPTGICFDICRKDVWTFRSSCLSNYICKNIVNQVINLSITRS